MKTNETARKDESISKVYNKDIDRITLSLYCISSAADAVTCILDDIELDNNQNATYRLNRAIDINCMIQDYAELIKQRFMDAIDRLNH